MAIRTDRKVYDKLVTELDTRFQSIKTSLKSNYGEDATSLAKVDEVLKNGAGMIKERGRPYLLERIIDAFIVGKNTQMVGGYDGLYLIHIGTEKKVTKYNLKTGMCSKIPDLSLPADINLKTFFSYNEEVYVIGDNNSITTLYKLDENLKLKETVSSTTALSGRITEFPVIYNNYLYLSSRYGANNVIIYKYDFSLKTYEKIYDLDITDGNSTDNYLGFGVTSYGLFFIKQNAFQVDDFNVITYNIEKKTKGITFIGVGKHENLSMTQIKDTIYFTNRLNDGVTRWYSNFYSMPLNLSGVSTKTIYDEFTTYNNYYSNMRENGYQSNACTYKNRAYFYRAPFLYYMDPVL